MAHSENYCFSNVFSTDLAGTEKSVLAVDFGEGFSNASFDPRAE